MNTINNMAATDLTAPNSCDAMNYFGTLEGCEDISLRDEATKQFNLGNGRFQAMTFSEPVHYKENGPYARSRWQDIDNNLKRITDKNGRIRLVNRANDVKMSFAAEAGARVSADVDEGLQFDNLAQMEYNGNRISWTPEFADHPLNPVPAKVTTGEEMYRSSVVKAYEEGGRKDADSRTTDEMARVVCTPFERRLNLQRRDAMVAYRDLLPGVSAGYYLTGKLIKENLIVETPEALRALTVRISGDYDFRVNRTNAVEAIDRRSGQAVFTFASPEAWDAKGNFMYPKVNLENCKNFTRVRYEFNERALAESIYPITIDPVLKTAQHGDGMMEDTYIKDSLPNSNFGNDTRIVTGVYSSNINIGLFRLKKPLPRKASDTILSACLTLTGANPDYYSSSCYLGCYKVLKAWNPDTVTWNNFQPGAEGSIDSNLISFVTSNRNTRYWDITDEYLSWYKAGTVNHGFAIKRENSVTTRSYGEWYTSQSGGANSSGVSRPCVTVNYLSHAGRESWWQYEDMAAGRAGTMSVDLLNGNVIAAHPDVAGTGLILPLSVTHYYNSCRSRDNSCRAGYGWRTSAHMTLHKITNNSDPYYVWTDGDGTEHWFKKKDSANFEDMEGMSLKLKLDTAANTATITDKSHSDMVFPLPADENRTYISEIRDSRGNGETNASEHNNVMKFTWADASGELTKVVDGAQRETEFTYTEGLLTKITAPDNKWVRFEYSTGGQLIGVAYSDLESAQKTVYTYLEGTNLLTGVQNYDGLKVTATYESLSDIRTYVEVEDDFEEMSRRATAMELLHVNSGGEIDARGDRKLFEYLPSVTKVTEVRDASDDTGKTLTYQFNADGNVTCVYDELGHARFAKFEAGIPNNASDASRMQRAVINLVRGIDFADSWTLAKGHTSDVCARNTDTRCLSIPTYRMVKKGAGLTTLSQDVPVLRAGRHTFSVYVKIGAALTGGEGAYAGIKVGNQVYETEKMTALTTDASGGPAADQYERVFVTADVPDGTHMVTVTFSCDATAGTVFFGAPQLEAGEIPNRANLLVNGDFSSVDDSSKPLSWTSANSAPALRYRLVNGSTTYSWRRLEFNTRKVGWQFGCWPIVANAKFGKIEIQAIYDQNIRTAEFTNLFLHREQFGHTFAYDSNHNVTSVANLTQRQSKIQYDANDNVTSYLQAGASDTAANRYTFTYGSGEAQKRHLVRTEITPEGVKRTYAYDAHGNVTKKTNRKTGDGEYIETGTQYSASGNDVTQQIDARGNAVTYTLKDEDSGLVTAVTDPEGQTVAYDHDAADRVTGVSTTADEKTYRNAYTYENDRLKTVSHNTVNDGACDVTYTFAYDALGRKTTVKVGDQALSTNVYENDRWGSLKEVRYGNNGKVGYTYDDFGRLTGISYDGETAPRYTYGYGANGQAAVLRDENLGRVIRTEYDLAERPLQMTTGDSQGNKLYRATIKYDDQNRPERLTEVVGGEAARTTSYTCDKDNRVRTVTAGTGQKVEYTYDVLGRIAARKTTNGAANTTTYGYAAGNAANKTSPLVESIAQSSAGLNAYNFSYAYDNRGNILTATQNGVQTKYTYDALGQLVRVDDPWDTTGGSTGTTWTYAYDRGGNILNRKRYAYTTGTPGAVQQTIVYAYGNLNWKDQLTGYDGRTFTYDAIGNLTYDGEWHYNWQAGRQLTSMSKSGATITYQYDHNGLRTRKVATVDGVTTAYDYTLNGKLVSHLKVTKDNEVHNLHFYYDGQSQPAMVEYDGELYTCVHNLQGDIVAILDSAGAAVVDYHYDAWGK